MEGILRFGIFLVIFVVVAALEFTHPKRALTQNRWRRWGTNLGIIMVNVIAQRLTVGALAFTAALYAQQHGRGLFNVVALPDGVEWVAAFLILDFAIYLQHVMSHALPVFWRLHRVHHADLDLDLTSGLRFHPIEILVSIVYKAALVAAIGADPWVVVAFEAALNAAAVFTHGNIRIPESLDTALRWAVCTPDMHRVHHSIDPRETNTNFGFFLSVWDRLCGTMRRAPALGHEGMVLGLAEYRDQNRLGLLRLLVLPFQGRMGGYSFQQDDGDAPAETPQQANAVGRTATVP
ncbi:MAG TPA: sterol desaturase family protein [Azospirillaceae bacterium]|nr:sterol desaturase family protein [Azospirillaceae bacterium]